LTKVKNITKLFRGSEIDLVFSKCMNVYITSQWWAIVCARPVVVQENKKCDGPERFDKNGLRRRKQWLSNAKKLVL